MKLIINILLLKNEIIETSNIMLYKYKNFTNNEK